MWTRSHPILLSSEVVCLSKYRVRQNGPAPLDSKLSQERLLKLVFSFILLKPS